MWFGVGDVGVDLLAGAVGAQVMTETSASAAPRVAVMDSGLGGLTVFSEVARALPGAEFTYLADNAGFPYGRLSETALVARMVRVIDHIVATQAPDVVVIACNTASTLALPVLRARHGVPFVGTVPAIKPAAELSQSKLITVLATPGTVARDYTRELVARYAGGCAVNLVGAPRLAAYAEAGMMGAPVSDEALAAEIAPCFREEGGRRTDAVVLACTHYPLLRARLERLAPWPVTWIDPAAAIARRVAAVLGDVSGRDAPRERPRAVFTKGFAEMARVGKALEGWAIHRAEVEELIFEELA